MVRSKSIKKITREDLAALRTRMFAKDTLSVVVVGDIDANTLAGMLDQIFGGLPAKAKLTPVAQVIPKATEKLKVVEMAVPQSVARFGLPAMPRKDKDFLPAFVLNQIVGGGVMSSRLWEEVREKRGLAYSVVHVRAAVQALLGVRRRRRHQERGDRPVARADQAPS